MKPGLYTMALFFCTKYISIAYEKSLNIMQCKFILL